MGFLDEKTYVDQAENVLKELSKPGTDKMGNKRPAQLVTTSKIRNILSMAADIYDNVLQNSSSELSSDIVGRIEYLRVRMIYEAGRDGDKSPTRRFIDESHLLDYVKMISNDKKKFILFYRYMEALVAFHKYYGGKEN